jgi:hypothetical protein
MCFRYFSELYNSLREDGARQLLASFISSNTSGSQEGNSMLGKLRASDPRDMQSARQHSSTSSEHAVEPSGPSGDNPATAGPGPTKVQSGTPENRLGRINPSAPEDVNTTPATTGEK